MKKINKRILKFLIIILLLFIVFITSFLVFNYLKKNTYTNTNKKDEVHEKTENSNNENFNLEKENTENLYNDNNIETEENDDNKVSNDVEHSDNNGSLNNNIPSNNDSKEDKNNNENVNQNISSNTDDTNLNNGDVAEKTICSNNDAGYIAFLANYKSLHPTYFTFNSESEAYAFGEKAMTDYGYMYQRNTLPVVYDGEKCYKEIWYVRLTITANSCTKDGVYNDVIHIPATSTNLINIYDYLRNIGYDCGNKQWFY